jgi:vacuolar-type H+-ATPase subunit F/Vma7
MTGQALIVITRPGLSAGFELAGVHVIPVPDSSAAAHEVERIGETPAVVIIDESLYRDLPEEMRRSLSRSAVPVVIPVPGPDWTAASTAHEYIVEILRRAIGYRVRLQ